MNISSGSRPGRSPSSATNNAGRSGSAAELQNIKYIHQVYLVFGCYIPYLVFGIRGLVFGTD